MFKIFSLIAILVCLHSQFAFPQSPLVKADRIIEISTMVAQMKYDRTSFSAKPGEIIRIILKNPDDLPHNLILCKPTKDNKNDQGKAVADAVIELGLDGVLQNWIPKKHIRLLAHTGMVNPKEEGSVTFLVPKKEGPYPYVCTFPGHAQMMNGVMIVAKNASPMSDLTYKYYHGKWDKLPHWDNLKPKSNGSLEEGFFSTDSKDRKTNFGFLFEGKIEIPQDGDYEFFLQSDGGSELYVGGTRVVLVD